LGELKSRLAISYLFITHDLAVVQHFADRVLVLHDGAMVEEGDAQQICRAPEDPYTQRLIAAAPVPDPRMQRERRAARLAMA
jgi:peptide/nickel transport system ATP-binding protein